MKRFLSLLTIIILVASVGVLTGCGPEIVGTKLSESQDMSGTVAGKLTLNGSTSMTRVCQALGETFSEKYPGVSVEKREPVQVMLQILCVQALLWLVICPEI